MADTDIGKAWETVFKKCWQKSFPKSWVFRLKDQMTGFKETSGNPCDFLCFTDGKLFLMECKAHKGASIQFTAIPQYERLLEHKGYPGVIPGVTIWFYEKDIIIWVSIEDMERMFNKGEKSIGLRMLKDKSYNIITIPAEKKRVYMDADYSILKEVNDDR